MRWKSRASGTSPLVDFTYSGEGCPSHFWGVLASDTTTRFFVLSVPGAVVVVRLPPPGGAPTLLFVFLLPAAQGLHGFLTALHRAGWLYQQGTMFHSGASGSAVGYFLYCWWSLMYITNQ
jgi:hypothetical protein